MGGVFKDVTEGHGGEGELVDEESLIFALDEVQNYHRHAEILGG